MNLDSRHGARLTGDRRGVFVAQSRRSWAHQNKFAVEGVGGKFAKEHIQIRKLLEVARRTREWHEIQVITCPMQSVNGLTGICLSGQWTFRGPPCWIGHREHRQCKIWVACHAAASTKKSAAKNTVRIQFCVDLGKLGGCIRKHGHGQCFAGHFAIDHTLDYRQYDATIAAYGFAKEAVRIRIARIRFRQDNIEPDYLGALCGQLVNQRRIYRARPRKATDLLQAFFVNADNDDVFTRRALDKLYCVVVERLVHPKKPPPIQGGNTSENQ